MPNVKFVALGGGQHVGASCYFLQVNDKNLLFDCGKGNEGQKMYIPNFDTLFCNHQLGVDDYSNINGVFISHAHFDHVGYLISLIKNSRNLPVYATNLTKNIYSYLISPQNHNEMLKWSEKKRIEYGHNVQKVLEHTQSVNYNHRYKIADDFYFTLYPAGHIPGAAMIYVEIYGVNILYTGDFSMAGTPLAPPCKLPDGISPDIAIICGTHAKHPNYNPSDDLENKIISLCRQYSKKNLYCNVKQLTKGIELVQIMRNAMNSHRIPQRPIYVDPEIWRFAEKLEECGTRVFDGNCSCFKNYIDNWKIPDGIYIGDSYYSRNFEIVEDVVFTLHATFDDISRLITKYSPGTVVIVHSVDDRENKYDNKLSNRFPDKNIIYADDNTIYDLMKEGMIYDKQKVR